MNRATIIEMHNRRRYVVLAPSGDGWRVPAVADARVLIEQGQVVWVRNCRSARGSNPGPALIVRGDPYERTFINLQLVESIYKWPVEEEIDGTLS